jgi:hypothetical protein
MAELPAQEEPTTSAEPRAFTQVLHELRRGGVHVELSESLAELVAAVREHKKPGTLTLTLKVQPEEDDREMVAIYDTVKLSKPQPTKAKSLFFTDQRGSITKTNPRQPELPLGVAQIGKASGE